MQASRVSKYPMVEMSDAIDMMIQLARQKFQNESNSVIEKSINEIISGEILAEDVKAEDDLPPYRASIMDGYAIKSDSAKKDTVLIVQTQMSGFAGSESLELDKIKYESNNACYVTTGGPVPSFFDCVIPIEDTELLHPENVQKGQNYEIKLKKGMASGQFIRQKGSDIQKGEIILEKHSVIKSAQMGLLATMGKLTGIKIYQKPKIGIISTGNELMPADTKDLKDGQIRDSNKLMFTQLLKENQVCRGDSIVDYGIVKDLLTDLEATMQKASQECDIVITSGGVSMGELDLVKPYLEKNGKIHFGRLNMRPGKPATMATLNNALMFSLPGNPVSAFVTANLFVIPAAKILMGQTDSFNYLELHSNVQLIPRKVKLDKERPEYHRVILVQEIGSGGKTVYAFSTGSQLSSRLLSAKNANGLVILPSAIQNKGSEDYTCTGSSTRAVVIGAIVSKSKSEIKDLLDKYDVKDEFILGSCCEYHHNLKSGHSHSHEEPSQTSQTTEKSASHDHKHDHNKEETKKSESQQQIQQPSSDAMFKVGLLTISDRASENKYPTGDLSGKALEECCNTYPKIFGIQSMAIVPDDIREIQMAILNFKKAGCHLILTSGGTGFAPKDVTPEATLGLITRRADQLLMYMNNEAIKIVPTACLSRGIIGMIENTMIVNLPGKPKAVTENFEILMRKNVIVHAIAQAQDQEKH